MISPRDKLLFWTGMVLIPCSLAVAVMPQTLPVMCCLVAAFLVIVVLDAVRAMKSLDGITATFDEVVRLTKDRDGAIPVLLGNEGPHAKRVHIGLALPPTLSSARETQWAKLPADAASLRMEWPCTPLRRGHFVVENVYLEASSPFGLWDYRATRAAQTELRVYPDLLPERNQLAALFLNRGGLGIHPQRRVGKGRDFEKLREYIPGDSFEDIHWKATARRGYPVTKVYQLERTQEVYVVIDASRLSGRVISSQEGEGSTTQLDRFLEAALVLGLVAEKQGDHYGVISFSDRVHGFIRARNGQAHYNACRDMLYMLGPQTVNPDFEELFTFVRLRLRRRALLVFLTNLDDPVLAEGFASNIRLLARRHLVLANMLTAPGVGPLFTKEDVQDTDKVYERLGGHLQWRGLRELSRVLQRQGVRMSLVDSAALSPDLVTQYLNVKQRQIL